MTKCVTVPFLFLAVLSLSEPTRSLVVPLVVVVTGVTSRFLTFTVNCTRSFGQSSG